GIARFPALRTTANSAPATANRARIPITAMTTAIVLLMAHPNPARGPRLRSAAPGLIPVARGQAHHARRATARARAGGKPSAKPAGRRWPRRPYPAPTGLATRPGHAARGRTAVRRTTPAGPCPAGAPAGPVPGGLVPAGNAARSSAPPAERCRRNRQPPHRPYGGTVR